MWLKKQKQTFLAQAQVWGQLIAGCNMLHWSCSRLYQLEVLAFVLIPSPPKTQLYCLHAFHNMSANFRNAV